MIPSHTPSVDGPAQPPLRVLLSWSSGKDSVWTLRELRQTPGVEVVGLLTTLNEAVDRVAMHAVRRELLEAQAASVGLPLITIGLPWPCSNADYEQRMGAAVADAVRRGITHIAFGDLFLEDIRQYRVQRLQGSGIEPLFPLWGRNTQQLAQEMVDQGLRAIITSVDPQRLSSAFAGRVFDAEFLRDLPSGVDPCGEHGEFHSFVYCGPGFAQSLDVEVGDVVERDGFWYADVVGANAR